MKLPLVDLESTSKWYQKVPFYKWDVIQILSWLQIAILDCNTASVTMERVLKLVLWYLDHRGFCLVLNLVENDFVINLNSLLSD